MNVPVPEELLERLAELVAERVAARLEASAHGIGGGDSWRLFSVEEVAAVLGRSTRWVHDAVRTRGLPYLRLDGGGKAFELDAVREWARRRSVPAPGSER